MPDQTYTLPADTQNTGKKVDVSELTVGAAVVERQRLVIADDSDATGLAKVQATDVVGTEAGVVTRPIITPLDVALSTRLKPGDLNLDGSKNVGVVIEGQSGVVATAVTNFPETQPVSAAALPLPNGASTEATLETLAGKDFATQTTLALIKAKTDNIDVALSTRTKPADQQHVIVDSSVSVAVTGPATDTQMRATPIPVNGTVTAVSGPSGSLSTGQNAAVTTTPAKVTASVTACVEVLVQAASANTDIVRVGSSAGQYIEIQPGLSATVSIDDVSKVYAVAVSGTQTVNWLARS